MRQIRQRQAIGDAPLEKPVDARDPPRRQPLGLGVRTQLMLEAGGEEHQFRGLVAGVVGAVAEVHARPLQRTRAAVDRAAHGFTRGGRCLARGAGGLSGAAARRSGAPLSGYVG
jgi:hypothetical protein